MESASTCFIGRARLLKAEPPAAGRRDRHHEHPDAADDLSTEGGFPALHAVWELLAAFVSGADEMRPAQSAEAGNRSLHAGA